MAIKWLNNKLRATAHTYVEAILEACTMCKVKDVIDAFKNTDAYPRLQKISEVEFAIGWLNGCAEAIGIEPVHLFEQVAFEIEIKKTKKGRAA